MPGLIGQLIQRGWQANQDRALLESLANYGQTPGGAATAPSGAGTDNGAAVDYGNELPQPAAGGQGGFNPSQAGQGGSGSGDDEGPSAPAQQGIKADALRKVIMAYNPGAKDLHTAVKGLSTDQLEGIVKGFAVQSTMAEHAARMADFQAQAKQRAQNALDDQSVGAAVNRYGSLGPVTDQNEAGEPFQRDPTAQERMSAALSTPGLAGRAVPKLIDALTKYGQAAEGAGGAPKPAFTPGPFKGTSVVTVPGSKAFQVMQDQSGNQLQPAVDANGNEIAGLYQFGNKTVTAPQQKVRPVPEGFHKAMDQVSSDITMAQGTLDDPKADPDKKARAQRTLTAARAQGKAIADRYHAAGDIPDELHQQTYQELGLPMPQTGNNGNNGTNTGTAAQAPAGKVRMVAPDGKTIGWVPVAQKATALAQGYKLAQ